VTGVIERQGERHQRSPGMADHDRPLDAEQTEDFRQDGGLRRRGPVAAPRPVAVAKARPVECHGAIPAGRLVDDTADQQILYHRPIAVQEQDRLPASTLDIVQARPARGHEPSQWRITPLGLSRMPVGDDRGGRQGDTGNADQTADCRGAPTPLRC